MGDGPGQGVAQHAAALDRLVQGQGIGDDLAAALVLDPVEREVGGALQRFGIRAVRWEAGVTDAGGQREVGVLGANGPAQRLG